MIKFDAFAILRDEESSGTNGGTFTSGAWRTRTLNTESSDADGIVSLSSNQFTLAAGKYLISARAPAFKTGRHKARLYNITDSSVTLQGTSEFVSSSTDAQTESLVIGLITIAGTKTFELQHICETTATTYGFGIATVDSTTEVYAVVEIRRVVEVDDLKISDLSAITTLAGTEEFVVADSGASKKITAANLFGSWTSYTATLGAVTTPPTLGTGGSAAGQYIQIGDLVMFSFLIQFGTSGAAGGTGDYTTLLPVSVHADMTSLIGSLHMRDPGGNTVRSGALLRKDSTTAWLLRDDSTAFVNPTGPWTWGNDDAVYGFGSYKAA